MSRDLARLQERLLQIFLRLCGYFPIGFVMHTAVGTGSLAGEVDTLAVRFPRHSESETGNIPPAWLNVPRDKIDLIVCEAKTSSGSFNKSLKDIENLRKVIRRFGIVDEVAAQRLADQAKHLLNSKLSASSACPTIEIPEVSAQLRFLMFQGEGRRSPHNEIHSSIFGNEVLAHVWSCFTLTNQPGTCQRSYDIEHWSPNDDIVKVLKDSATPPKSLKDLLTQIENAKSL